VFRQVASVIRGEEEALYLGFQALSEDGNREKEQRKGGWLVQKGGGASKNRRSARSGLVVI